MPKSISISNTCTTKIQPEPLLSATSKPSTSVGVANTASEPVVAPSYDVSGQLPTQASQETTEPRKMRITPVVLRDASRWRAVNHKFISIGTKIERAVAVDEGIRIIPRSEDDYREEDVPHHTFPLPSERNVHAVIKGVPATLKQADIKEELQQKGYAPLHFIRLKRSGAPMPLVVVILPKLEKSRELFNEHELLPVGLSIRVEDQKNTRLIGQCHRCQKYGHAQSYCTAPSKCLKCASDHMTHLCPQTGLEERKCVNCGDGHPANGPICRFAPRRNLQVIAQRRKYHIRGCSKKCNLDCSSFEPFCDSAECGPGNRVKVLTTDHESIDKCYSGVAGDLSHKWLNTIVSLHLSKFFFGIIWV
nr:unnamed protein product [Callosobruchus analis]